MLTSTEVLVPFLSQTVYWLLGAVVGLVFYVILTNDVVFEHTGRVRSHLFGGWDAVIASCLGAGFLFIIFLSAESNEIPEENLSASGWTIVAGMFIVAAFSLLLISGVLAALQLRGIKCREVFGFDRPGFLPGLGWAALLLALAYPLVEFSSVISDLLLSASGSIDNSQQQLVTFFIDSPPSPAKWLAAVFAVIVAPMQEEFLFRGYIYGVVRRYGGVPVGLLFNATLFAAIHLNLASFLPLFVLAVCLSLAYEFTGSLWVPMGMHAMFNSITLINILLVQKNS